MKKITLAALVGATLAITRVGATELPECHLTPAERGHPGGQFQSRAPTSRLELDPAALKTGQEITYQKDQPILNTDYRVVTAGNVLVANADFMLKSSWMTNPDWKFKRGQVINGSQAFVMPDGKAFTVIRPQSDMVLFMTPEGEFCNQTLKITGTTWTWLMGHLSRLPDNGTLEWQTTDHESQSGRLRVIYNGASAGAMHFQEVWVKGDQIMSSNDRQFDQFADTIEIAHLKFHVAEAKADSVKVSYAFGANGTQ